MRVLHAPTDVGGNPQGLAQAERLLGQESDSIVFAESLYRYPGKTVLFRPSDGFFRREIRRFLFFWRAASKYDVFHFNFGQSLFPSEFSDTTARWEPGFLAGPLRKMRKLYCRIFSLKDLFLLRLLRKRIFVTYQGDDARQASYCRDNFAVHFVRDVPPEYYPDWLEKRKPWRIARFEKYAHKIYAVNPDLLWVLPKRAEFVPYCHIDLKSWVPTKKNSLSNSKLHIIHAPSDRSAKGTKYLLQALDVLKSEGYAFHFTLVEKMSNSQARKLYEQADVLVDQLLAGWYGGLAVELMALGKPVIAYIRESDLVHIPSEMKADLPILNAEPQTIYEVLKALLSMKRQDVADIGLRSRQFVEKWHDPLKIAARIIEDYRDPGCDAKNHLRES